jgi:ActR/RegA family two-component response regulator
MRPDEHYSKDGQPAPTIRRRPPPHLGTTVEPRLVLVALEDGRFRAAAERMLRLQGFAVRVAASASDAIDVIRAERPAAAIVDLGDAGSDVAVAMPLPRPVVLLSSAARTSGLVARIRPRTRSMAKPCSIILLIEALQEMLASAERARDGSPGPLVPRPSHTVADFPPSDMRP